MLVIEREPAALRYRLVDEDRQALLAEGTVIGIGMPVGEVTHTVRVIAEPGVPSVTMLSETARTPVTVIDESAAVEVILEQFAEHGPALAELAPRFVGPGGQ